MAKIKYAVVGIDQQSLNNLIGTLAHGQVEGPADTIVLPAPVPTVYQYTIVDMGKVQLKEVSFTGWLSAKVAQEIRRLVKDSSGEQVIKDVVGQLTSEQGV